MDFIWISYNASINRNFLITNPCPQLIAAGKMPPPHSTGAAIDVTLFDADLLEMNMGSPIDEISDRSLPNYFANSIDNQDIRFHSDRQLLNKVMTHSGFQRHPNEWLHFSCGDQLWAWISKKKIAIYGGVV